MAKVVLVDDHILLRNGLAALVVKFGHTVLFEADNGLDFSKKLSASDLPDIVLMDINMPLMDGFETSNWLKMNYSSVKVLALSMYDSENAIIKMLKSGPRGYILKDSEPVELQLAMEALVTKGFFYSELVSGKLMHALNTSDAGDLNNREIEFLKYACSELTYKEIAEKMYVSPRTVDGYRDALFEKLNVKTRVGLVMYAIKNEIVMLK